MAQVLVTSDDGRILFDGTISLQHAQDLVELIQEEFMAKEWLDVPEEELGLETEQAIEQVREEPGYKEVPKGFPVMQRRRLASAITRLISVGKAIKIEDWDDSNKSKDRWRKVHPRKENDNA